MDWWIDGLDDDGAGAGAGTGGVLAKGFGPGAVAVAVLGFADETDFAGRCNFLSESAEVRAELFIGGDAEFAVLEFAAKGEGEFFFAGAGEGDRFDLPAEAVAGAFGELHAEARGVDAGAFELGEPEEGVKSLLDFGEGFAEELVAETIKNDAMDPLSDVDDTEVVFAGDIKAEKEFLVFPGVTWRGGEGLHELFEGEEVEFGVGAGVEHFIGEEGGIFVGGDAAVFLVPGFLVGAFAAEALEEMFAGFVGAFLFVDAFDDALGDGFLDGDFVEGPAHGITVFGVLDELIEEGADTAVGGDDRELAAPHGNGFGDAIEEALVGVEGELVEGNVAAFAGEGVGVGRKGVDAATVGELEGESREAGGGIEEDLTEVDGAAVEEVGPVETILELEASLLLVTGGDVGIEASVFVTDKEDEAEAVGEGESGLT
jgi:hypothetical protein